MRRCSHFPSLFRNLSNNLFQSPQRTANAALDFQVVDSLQAGLCLSISNTEKTILVGSLSRQAGFNPFIIPASEPCPTSIDELFKASTSSTQSKDDQVVLVREDGSTVRFRITGERLFVNRCLVGRGTQVYPVQVIDGTDPDVEQVLKMTWPDDQRIREADVICSSDMTAEQLRLPRHLLGINVAEDLERRLHAIVMSRYKALWNVDSVEEFQDVFTDCVECKYLLAILVK